MKRVYETRISHNTLLIERFVERCRDDYVTKAERYPSAIQLISYSRKTANYDSGAGGYIKFRLCSRQKLIPRLVARCTVYGVQEPLTHELAPTLHMYVAARMYVYGHMHRGTHAHYSVHGVSIKHHESHRDCFNETISSSLVPFARSSNRHLPLFSTVAPVSLSLFFHFSSAFFRLASRAAAAAASMM